MPFFMLHYEQDSGLSELSGHKNTADELFDKLHELTLHEKMEFYFASFPRSVLQFIHFEK